MEIQTIMELCTFSLKTGVSKEAFANTQDDVNRWLQHQPGFMSRSLCFDPQNNRWRDMVRWDNLALAQDAGEAFMQSSEVQEFLRMIDESSLSMEHIPIQCELAA